MLFGTIGRFRVMQCFCRKLKASIAQGEKSNCSVSALAAKEI